VIIEQEPLPARPGRSSTWREETGAFLIFAIETAAGLGAMIALRLWIFPLVGWR
jgi:hypothetical protein